MRKHAMTIVACASLLMCLATAPAEAQTLTLDECISKATANYPAVKKYGLIEKTRDYNLSNAARSWLPQIGVSAGAYAFTDIIDADMLSKMEAEMENYLITGSLTISQNIYDAGQSAAARRTARAQAEVETKQVDVTIYEVEERVEQVFFGLLMLEEQTEQNRLLQDDLAITYRSVESMMTGGIANESDLEAVRVEQIKAEQAEGSLRSMHRAYLRMLGVLMGESLGEGVKLAAVSEDLQPSASDGFLKRPEMSLFNAQESLIDAQRKQLNTRLRPTLSAFAAGITHTSVTSIMRNSVLAGGLSLSWNFGALYTRKNDIGKLEAQRKSVASDRETFIFNTRLEEEDTNGAIESLRTQIAQDAEIVRLRESIRSKSERKVQLGTESVNEMLRDINAVSQARQQLALHEIELKKELYNLNHIMGK